VECWAFHSISEEQNGRATGYKHFAATRLFSRHSPEVGVVEWLTLECRRSSQMLESLLGSSRTGSHFQLDSQCEGERDPNDKKFEEI